MLECYFKIKTKGPKPYKLQCLHSKDILFTSTFPKPSFSRISFVALFLTITRLASGKNNLGATNCTEWGFLFAFKSHFAFVHDGLKIRRFS